MPSDTFVLSRPYGTDNVYRLQVIHVAACNLLLSVVIVQSGMPGEDDLISWRQLLVSYNRPITWSGLLFFGSFISWISANNSGSSVF